MSITGGFFGGSSGPVVGGGVEWSRTLLVDGGTGSDANDGYQQPVQTLARAMELVGSGQTVLIAEGEYAPQALNITGSNVTVAGMTPAGSGGVKTTVGQITCAGSGTKLAQLKAGMLSIQTQAGNGVHTSDMMVVGQTFSAASVFWKDTGSEFAGDVGLAASAPVYFHQSRFEASLELYSPTQVLMDGCSVAGSITGVPGAFLVLRNVQGSGAGSINIPAGCVYALGDVAGFALAIDPDAIPAEDYYVAQGLTREQAKAVVTAHFAGLSATDLHTTGRVTMGAVALEDLPTGGEIDAEGISYIKLDQTTASQSIFLADLTTDKAQVLFVEHTGSASGTTLEGSAFTPNSVKQFMWTGNAWAATGVEAPSTDVLVGITYSEIAATTEKDRLVYAITESLSVPNRKVWRDLPANIPVSDVVEVGIMQEDLLNNQDGTAIVLSSSAKLWTNSLGIAGQHLYYGWDGTNIALTETKPTIGKYLDLGLVLASGIAGGYVRIAFEPKLEEGDGCTVIWHKPGDPIQQPTDYPQGTMLLRNPTGTSAGGLPEKVFVRSPAGTWHEVTQRPLTTSGTTWGGRPASPREGDVYSVVVGGITYRKAIYRAGAWDIEVGPYPHLQALAYVAGDLIYKDRVFYTANGTIPEGTEFAEGIAGPTWRKWTTNTRREITKMSNGGSNGLLFVAEGRLYSARAQEGNGAWISAMADYGRFGSFNNGIRNAYEIVIPDMGSATVVDANVINTMAYALLSDGRLYTWGNNTHGALGVGDYNPRYLPTLSKTGVAKVFTHHSQEQRSFDFVRIFIQDTAGEVWWCGYTAQGQSGTGTQSSTPTWTKVTAAGVNPKSVWVMGSYIGFTIIQKADGNVLIAGYARGGGGLGVVASGYDVLSFVDGNVWIGGDTTYTIKQVEAGFGYYDTTANDRMNMAVLSDNGTASRLLSCGDNSWGTVGNGTNTGTNILVPTAPVGLVARVKKIVRMGDAPGSMHALDYDGNLWSWGRGGQGALGRSGVTADTGTPGIAQTGVIDIFQISAAPQWGYETTSPIIQKSDGYYCSGWNGVGLIGNASITQSNTYVKMRLPAGIVLKHVGQHSSHVNRFTRVAVSTDDQIFVWGYGGNYNIDGVTTANCVIPIDVTPAALNR